MKCFKNLLVAPSEVKVISEGNVLRIFFDYEKQEKVSPVDGMQDDTSVGDNYMCCNVDVVGNRSYGGIVSAIIIEKYDASKMDAIRLDYELAKDSASSITDEKRAEYLSNYNAMQEWRSHAKEIAKKVLTLI